MIWFEVGVFIYYDLISIRVDLNSKFDLNGIYLNKKVYNILVLH